MPFEEQTREQPERKVEVPREVVEAIRDEESFGKWFENSFEDLTRNVEEVKRETPVDQEFPLDPRVEAINKEIDNVYKETTKKVQEVAQEGLTKTDIGNIIAKKQEGLIYSEVGVIDHYRNLIKKKEAEISQLKSSKMPGWKGQVERKRKEIDQFQAKIEELQARA